MKEKARKPVTPSPNGSLKWELKPSELGPVVNAAALGFQSTEALEVTDRVIGQDRALRALEFGLALRHRGYNVYISGLTGTGRKHLVQRLLEKRAAQEPTPDDWAYVHNFEEPDRPLALRLPSGHGALLATAVEHAIEHLKQDLPAALKAKDFDSERERLTAKYGKGTEGFFNELAEHGRELDLAIRRLPTGVLVFYPLKEGKPLESEEVEKLSAEEKADIERRQEVLGEHASRLFTQQQELSRQLQNDIEDIVRTFARRILDPLIQRVKSDFPGEQVSDWLDRVRDHLLHNLGSLREEEPAAPPNDLAAALRLTAERKDHWLEYRVNVVADNSRTQGAPVVLETSPTYKNLFGTIEHEVNLFGRVTTNFSHIKPGSLLRANGGYLVLDLEDALTEPLVWKQLKRALKSGQLMTDVYEPLGLFAPTTALKPQPIPIETKVVVLGSEEVYYLLQYYDEDFRELFRVKADFSPEMPGNAENHKAYAQFVARQVREEKLLPFNVEAVVEVIRFGARTAGHQEKLSVEFGVVADVIREADHWARVAGASEVNAGHVLQALDERVYRSDYLATKIRELIQEGTLQVSVEGKRVGQINGLAVLSLDDFSFGRPNRITASAGVGQEGLVNIERESDLSGRFHDKGILILEGYLRNRYARQHPLALSAGLTFEQSYGWVEGDSASSAELYCLLSALAEIPLRQDVAVTGSVNQHGQVQAVGGVNEKIEGFFDVCKTLGLTGTQGVCIPRSNVRHLVLRRDVIKAISEGRFHVWAVDTIDEGIELLTGLRAGDPEQEGTFHHRLDQRLQEMLGVLQEKPTTGVSPRIRLAPPATPTPVPPRLPGEGDGSLPLA